MAIRTNINMFFEIIWGNWNLGKNSCSTEDPAFCQDEGRFSKKCDYLQLQISKYESKIAPKEERSQNGQTLFWSFNQKNVGKEYYSKILIILIFCILLS